jgi:hypothetical protein
MLKCSVLFSAVRTGRNILGVTSLHFIVTNTAKLNLLFFFMSASANVSAAEWLQIYLN